jgi:hypothetical protein
VKTENANARSNGSSKGSRSGRNSLRASVAGARRVDGRQPLAVEVLEPGVEPVRCEARRRGASRPQQASDPHGGRLSAV